MSLSPVTELDDELEQAGKPAGPCAMVVFGATGDLTMRKLVPALFNLEKAHLLPSHFAVVGVAIDEMSPEEFRAKVTRFIPMEEHGSDVFERFEASLHYLRGDFATAGTFSELSQKLATIDEKFGTDQNYLFYMATAPKFFSEIVQQLGQSGLSKEENGHWRRVVIEKPFGQDLDSALALNYNIKAVLSEKQIYRIDHYLGKETVQNIMVFRFGNGIFEPIWNRRYIDHVAITNAETVG
ncbi:MAG: glucose-6-phosphate dehydrogenase, partial [Candidatus Korobacteraceae bacterium]